MAEGSNSVAYLSSLVALLGGKKVSIVKAMIILVVMYQCES